MCVGTEEFIMKLKNLDYLRGLAALQWSFIIILSSSSLTQSFVRVCVIFTHQFMDPLISTLEIFLDLGQFGVRLFSSLSLQLHHWSSIQDAWCFQKQIHPSLANLCGGASHQYLVCMGDVFTGEEFPTSDQILAFFLWGS